MYFLRIRWAYDDESVEQFATYEEREQRIAYLKTLPKHEGVRWTREGPEEEYYVLGS